MGTIMTPNDLARLMQLTSGPDHLRPCLVGHTGVGKTALVQAAAKELGLPLQVLLLQAMLPEDILGLPQRGRTGVRWLPPEWAIRAANEPTVLFMDELDKPGRESIAAVLTLMRSLSLHGVRLHDKTVIVAAMQPVDRAIWLTSETTRALAARLIFLPLAPATGYDYVARTTGATWATDLAAHLEPVDVPALEIPSPRQVDDLIRLARAGVDPHLLAEGSAHGKMADWLAARLAEEAGKAKDADPPTIDAMPVEAVAAALPRLAVEGPVEQWQQAIVRVYSELPPEAVQAAMQAQYEAVAKAGQWCGEASERDIARAIRAAARAVGRTYRVRRWRAA